jgi:hypothetical protein
MASWVAELRRLFVGLLDFVGIFPLKLFLVQHFKCRQTRLPPKSSYTKDLDQTRLQRRAESCQVYSR